MYHGNVEKSHQRRSPHFAVLINWKYAPRVNTKVFPLRDALSNFALQDAASHAAAFPSAGIRTGLCEFVTIPASVPDTKICLEPIRAILGKHLTDASYCQKGRGRCAVSTRNLDAPGNGGVGSKEVL